MIILWIKPVKTSKVVDFAIEQRVSSNQTIILLGDESTSNVLRIALKFIKRQQIFEKARVRIFNAMF